MATNPLQSLHHHHHHHSLLKLQPLDSNPISSVFLKPTNTNTSLSLSLSSSSSSSSITTTTTTITFSISPTTSTTLSTSQTSSLDLLHQYLSTQNFRQADEETRRLLIILAGEAAQKRGYIFFSEVQFISEEDLKAIDDLWKKFSKNKFGYSIQKKIWLKKAKKDFSKFFLKVGWMKKLDTEVEQYNYRSFPNEFIWELEDDTPEGHLPLTNALRGTQLLNSILTHPAFDVDEEQEQEQEKQSKEDENGVKELRTENSKPLSKRLLKPDYSF